MPISFALLPEFEHEMAGTRKTIERMPEDRLEWRPHPRSATMGRLATHLAELAGFAERALTSESFDMRPGGAAMPARELGSCAEILDLFDRNVAAGKAAIAATGDAEWMAPWTLLANGQVVFHLPRVAVVRHSVLNHSIHHRAQLTVYLRLNDVAVPALYGPSADE
jgi:uncharacterized damage-inducible protein DinB